MTEAVTEPVAEPVTEAVVEPVVAPERPPHRARTATEQGENLGKIVLYHQIESPQNPAIVTPAIVSPTRNAIPSSLVLMFFAPFELIRRTPPRGDAYVSTLLIRGCCRQRLGRVPPPSPACRL